MNQLIVDGEYSGRSVDSQPKQAGSDSRPRVPTAHSRARSSSAEIDGDTPTTGHSWFAFTAPNVGHWVFPGPLSI
ncbi:hypothetical protein ACGFX4_38855 [Kitasatospora sp. NPDC048365]|uniref:hypothetical protein n=1 Tax=Kitasatospora sp. NPDC048365 TaxID=3364050 RepID=UPI003721382D